MQVFITVGRAGCSLTLHNAISTGDPKANEAGFPEKAGLIA
jgi:hypothetical protein